MDGPLDARSLRILERDDRDLTIAAAGVSA